jgi:hypothetical protein
VRAHALLPVALLCTACSGAHSASDATASPQASPDRLRSCETRALTLDDADLVVTANVDGTPAAIVIVRAPSDDAKTKALADARADFGDPQPDTRTKTQAIKDGLSSVTDLCGRPLVSSPSPT